MADYRYNKLAHETVGWETSKGNKVEITVELIQEETDYFFNGDWEPTRNGLDVSYRATVDGKNHNVMGGVRSTGNPSIPHAIGNLGLIPENYTKLQVAKATVENHPMWQTKKIAEAKSEMVEKEYQDHVARVDAMMTMNGKTY